MKPGKLPHATLERLLRGLTGAADPRVLVGPRIGEDAAVVRIGRNCLIIATDPVTFAVDRLGWYAVQINANDVAAMGARPAWFQACVLLPPGRRVPVRRIFADIDAACRQAGVAVTGGHTEVTSAVGHPVVVGTMIGIAPAGRVLTSAGLRPGDVVVMAGTAAVEATAILARDCAARAGRPIPRPVLARARRFLFDPGISVVRPALAAAAAGATAMHDPTEGGVLTALYELAIASGVSIRVDLDAIPVREETQFLCERFGIDPLRAIASGALLAGVPPGRAPRLLARLRALGLPATRIGVCAGGRPGLLTTGGKLLRPTARDPLAG